MSAIASPPRPTQRHRVLTMLVRAGTDGLDGMDLYEGDDTGRLPNGRTRIYELEADGHCIETVPCDKDHTFVDHRGRAVRAPSHKVYRYRHGPAERCPKCITFGQLALAI